MVPDEQLEEWDIIDAPGWGLDGAKLHQEVKTEYWSITREDLKFFESRVLVAVHKGVIVPTPMDAFDPLDVRVGPNMYTVVQQYLLPITKRAGSMSFALLRHPQGLPCDLFITHCWSEGVYELIDKVLASWPVGKHHAYCCIFSNPQALDISNLIARPKDSPFAKCLTMASHVMVVPNSVSSIYTRLWCVYEVFLACEQDKVIFTASAPVVKKVIGNISLLLSVYSCCVVFFVVVLINAPSSILSTEVDEICLALIFTHRLPLTCKVSNCFQQHLPAFPLLFLVTSVGSLFSSLMLSQQIAVDGQFWHEQDFSSQEHVLSVLRVLMSFYFLIAEADRVYLARATVADAQLRKDFIDISAAQCSRDEDKIAIEKEIGESLHLVNETVVVLLEAGMSTQYLREAWEMQANIRHAGRWRLTDVYFIVIYMLGAFVSSVINLNLPDCSSKDDDLRCAEWALQGQCLTDWEMPLWKCQSTCGLCTGIVYRVFTVVCLILMFLFMFMCAWFALRHVERFAFAVSCSFRIVTLAMASLFFYVLLTLDTDDKATSVERIIIVQTVELGITLVLSLAFAVVGLPRIASISYIGPMLTHLLGPTLSCPCFNRKELSDKASHSTTDTVYTGSSPNSTDADPKTEASSIGNNQNTREHHDDTSESSI